MPIGWSITQIWVKPSGIPQIWVNPQIWAITQNCGNHAQITQNWVLHLFLRVVIYLLDTFIVLVLDDMYLCKRQQRILNLNLNLSKPQEWMYL